MPSVYASVGPDLAWYDVDVENCALARQSSVTLPGNVQEAWPHPTNQYLHVAWSTGGPSFASPGAGPPPPGEAHGITTFRIDSASGALEPHGKPVPIPSRPIHITVDIPGEHVLTAYNNPSGITVHRIQPDGTVGSEVRQLAPLDVGVYAHQVRVVPSNQGVILVTRGNAPSATKPEDPGAIKLFDHKDGLLANRASIAPGGGFGFQSRHVDFHPTGPWVFLSLEEQNKLQVYKLEGTTLSNTPLFTKDTLDAQTNRPRHALGTVHVHPSGNVVYVANRCSATTAIDGKPVAAEGGENSIAVFRVNADTGEPTRIQNIDTQGISPRTFAVDASGRILVVANQTSLPTRHETLAPASLALFRIADEGRLDFVRKYDVETGPGRSLFWTGMVL